jgi:peptidoglycan-associated lipoprotein
MNKIHAGLLAAAAALVVAGCSSTPVAKTEPAAAPAPAPAPAPVQQMAPAPQPVAPPMSSTATMVDPLTQGLLAKRSVYFEFDRSSINESDVAVVEAHGRYLVDHRARAVRVEGNCDERGSREYNLALGQRRADSVKDRLKTLGVAGDRIETTSFGKEKPRAMGHDEAAWAENRRADIVYR